MLLLSDLTTINIPRDGTGGGGVMSRGGGGGG